MRCCASSACSKLATEPSALTNSTLMLLTPIDALERPLVHVALCHAVLCDDLGSF